MSANSCTAIAEKNSFLDVEYCDHVPQTEPLRRHFSESDLAPCWIHINGTCKSKPITMVSHVAGMPQTFNDGEASSHGFLSQRASKAPGWDLRDFGNYPAHLENRWEDSRQSEDEEIASFSCKYPDSMENLSEGSDLPCKKASRPSRPCKGQRVRYRALTEKLLRLLRDDPDGFDVDKMCIPPSIAADSKRKARLVTYLQTEKEQILKDREIDRILPPVMVLQRILC